MLELYENLGLHPSTQSRPFKSIFSIVWRASQLLKKRTPLLQWRIAAEVLEGWIVAFKEDRLKQETEYFIENLSERLTNEGGWELDYLPRNSYDSYEDSGLPTQSEIRHLLENWPSGSNDQPDFPKLDDIDDLDALQDILCSGYPYDDIKGFSLAQEHELYAVLALMKIDLAASYLKVEEKRTDSGILIFPGSNPWKVPNLIAAGNLVSEAMEIICYAERDLWNAQLNEMRIERETRVEAKIKADTRNDNDKRRKEMLSAAGRQGATVRNQQYQELKAWARKKAEGMKDPQRDIARKLAARLPLHLADVSKEPERLIYDALRSSAKPD